MLRGERTEMFMFGIAKVGYKKVEDTNNEKEGSQNFIEKNFREKTSKKTKNDKK